MRYIKLISDIHIYIKCSDILLYIHVIITIILTDTFKKNIYMYMYIFET